MNSRYQIRRELGEGTFGKVVLCKDEQKSGNLTKLINNTNNNIHYTAPPHYMTM